MDIRIYSLCALIFVIPKVSSQRVTVEADQGGSVTLMCSSSRNQPDVFWRYKDSKAVYDIIEGVEDFHDQDAAYRGRVKGFPSEFKRGNYSIRLSDVKHTDAGTYSCQIPYAATVYVELKVKDESVTDQNISPNSSGVMRKAGRLSFLVVSLLLCHLKL